MPENEPATAAEVVSEVVAALLGLTILFSLFCMGTVMDSKIFGGDFDTLSVDFLIILCLK